MEEQNEGSKQISDALTNMSESAQKVQSASKEMSESNKSILEEMNSLQLATESYPTSLADEEFARLVELKTEGRVKVEVREGGALAQNEGDAIEGLQSGDLAFTRVSSSSVAAYAERIARQNGCQVIELTPQQRAEFEKAMEPVYNKHGAAYMSTINAIRDLR